MNEVQQNTAIKSNGKHEVNVASSHQGFPTGCFRAGVFPSKCGHSSSETQCLSYICIFTVLSFLSPPFSVILTPPQTTLNHPIVGGSLPANHWMFAMLVIQVSVWWLHHSICFDCCTCSMFNMASQPLDITGCCGASAHVT